MAPSQQATGAKISPIVPFGEKETAGQATRIIRNFSWNLYFNHVYSGIQKIQSHLMKNELTKIIEFKSN